MSHEQEVHSVPPLLELLNQVTQLNAFCIGSSWQARDQGMTSETKGRLLLQHLLQKCKEWSRRSTAF